MDKTQRNLSVVLGEFVVKIKDITEGLYDYVKDFQQKKQQADWTAGGPGKRAYMDYYERNVDRANRDYQTATAGKPQAEPEVTPPAPIPNPQEGSVLLVSAPNGNSYFKTYKGTWHIKGKSATDFSVGGTKVTEPKDIEALDRLLSNAKLVGVKHDSKDPTGNAWVYDQRKTALLAKRSGKK